MRGMIQCIKFLIQNSDSKLVSKNDDCHLMCIWYNNVTNKFYKKQKYKQLIFEYNQSSDEELYDDLREYEWGTESKEGWEN